jgi:hypothetical protein
VVFDEDNFPLTDSPSLTDLDFLCESGLTVSTIGTYLTTVGTSTSALLWLPYPPRSFLQASPVTYVRREVGAGAAGTRDAPEAALRQEVGAGAAGTRGTPGAALRREVEAGAAGTRGAPGAALRWEVGAGAAGTRGVPGATLSREVGAGAAGTRGDGNKSLYLVFVGVVFLSILDCF